jgi:hypothetical protein
MQKEALTSFFYACNIGNVLCCIVISISLPLELYRYQLPATER